MRLVLSLRATGLGFSPNLSVSNLRGECVDRHYIKSTLHFANPSKHFSMTLKSGFRRKESLALYTHNTHKILSFNTDS